MGPVQHKGTPDPNAKRGHRPPGAKVKHARLQEQFQTWQAWSRGLSVEEVFTRIYDEAKWGHPINGAKFYSGKGSSPEFTASYEQFVISFIIRNPQIRRIVDVGCGDFQVSGRILRALRQVGRAVEYLGCDVARNIVDYNLTTNAGPGVTFIQANVIEDRLPGGDLALVRQVLQHLTNDDIAKALKNIHAACRFMIITESLPTKRALPNIDIERGIATRVPLGSGVYLDEPPFTLPVHEMLDVPFSEAEFIRSSVTSRGR